MASLRQAVTMVTSLPEVTEGTRFRNRTWFVAGKAFMWERPFSKADLRRFGDVEPPDGPILAVAVDDLEEKDAVLAEGRPGLFTIPHFDGFPAVLVQLDVVELHDLRDAIVDAWLACAPGPLAEEFLADGGLDRG